MEETPVEETPVEETPAVETPVAETPHPVDDFALFEGEETPKKKKKSKKKLAIVLSSVTAFVVAVAVLVWFFWVPIVGFFIKTFGSEQDYLAYVLEQTTKQSTDSLLGTYGRVRNLLTGNGLGNASVNATAEITANKKAVSLAETALYSELGTNVDMSWLEDGVILRGTINSKEKLTDISGNLTIDDVEIGEGNIVLDKDDMLLYLGAPSQSDEYLCLDMDYDSYFTTKEYYSSYYDEYRSYKEPKDYISRTIVYSPLGDLFRFYENQDLYTALPSKEVLDELLHRYMQEVVYSLDAISMDSETLEISGVSQKLTKLSIKLDKEDYNKILQNVLRKALKDEQVMQLLEDYVEQRADQAGMDEEDLMESFEKLFDDILDELDKENEKSDAEYRIVLYVNGSHQIVGFHTTSEITTEYTWTDYYGKEHLEKSSDKSEYYCVEVRKGKNVASKLTIDSKYTSGSYESESNMEIKGEGTIENGRTTAEYKFSSDKTKYFTINLIDFSSKDNKLNGKIHITPTTSLVNEVTDGGLLAGSLISLLDLKLELDFETKKDTERVAINILNNDEVMLGIDLTMQEQKCTDVNVPSDSYVYELDKIDKWVKSLDKDEILDNLDDAGVPVKKLLGVK